jgi:hypothetical protein
MTVLPLLADRRHQCGELRQCFPESRQTEMAFYWG